MKNTPDPDEQRLLEQMILIRRLEQRLGSDSRSGQLPGNVHLCIGQEAIAVGVCSQLRDDDYIAGTHRSHGHFIAKGGSPNALVAEIYARQDGACGGLGGSMHVTDLSRGMLGANGIVGGSIGIAAGGAMAAQSSGRDSVSVCFFGDGASSEGVLAEVMNIAALWRLPLVLVCENNGYGGFTATGGITAGSIAARAAITGMTAIEIDGNDLPAVVSAAADAVARARRGDGPTFIEAHTYRMHGHVESEDSFLPKRYRSLEEIADWEQRDPIARLAASLIESGALTSEELAIIEARVARVVAEAVDFARASPPADPERMRLAGAPADFTTIDALLRAPA